MSVRSGRRKRDQKTKGPRASGRRNPRAALILIPILSSEFQPSEHPRRRIGERAEVIREQFDERHVTTEEARQQLELLAEETITAQQAQKDSGLDDLTFTLYWELKRHIYKDPKALAVSLAEPFKRFPNFHANPDEMRELKAQLYKLLLPSVQGKKMVEVAERLIKVRTP